MKLNKLTQVILIASSVLTLAACSHKKPNSSAIYAANAAYQDGAEAKGLGNESGYDEETGANGRMASNRIYYFDYDSNVVRDSDKPAVHANANYLLAHPGSKVMVEGHTDPRGSREYNVGLGERRARAVGSMMTTKGVKPSQLALVSYGAEKLATPGHSESDFQQDRRVALVYTNKQ